MGRHVTRHVTGSEDGPKGDGPRGWRIGLNIYIYMYVCMYRYVCEEVARLGHRLEDGEDGMDHRGAVWGCGAGPRRAKAGPHTLQSNYITISHTSNENRTLLKQQQQRTKRHIPLIRLSTRTTHSTTRILLP
ncbi:hypothetical protein HanRHA438_Chr01g0042171 [Helianthus annuus]|nr:hypothetical protein HanRHA438_Chr01g0042171 [Helianthus annuus]